MINNHPKKILLVEDETLIAMHEQMILEDYGYSVMVVSSGESAIVSVQNTPDIDLILMDINLGDGIDGTEAARQILAEHDIPLVFLSSHTEREVVEKTEGITSYGYIVKNSGETVLIASIKMAFRLFSARMKEKEKEQELEKSEENLLITLNSIGDGVIVTDNDGKVVRMNPVAEVLCGWSQSEARGKVLTEVFRIFHSITREPVKDPVRVVLEKGQIVGLGNHTVLLARDGKEYQISDSAASIRDKNGKTIGIVLVFSDVTESYYMRRKIEESEEKYRLIVEKANDGIEITQQDKIIFCNAQFARMLGYSIEELQQISFSQIFTDKATRALYERQKRRKAGNSVSHNYQTTFRRKDGSVIDVDVNYEIIDYQGNPATFAIIRDFTEQKKAAEALKHSHDLLQYIIEYSNSAIAVHDRDLRYIYVSRQYLKQYKVTEKEIIGKHHYDVFPDLPEKWRVVHQKALQGEVSKADNDPYVHADGSVDWTRWECRPWYESDGSIGGIIVYTEVITQQKKETDALKESEARFRLFAELAPVGIVISDKEENVKYVSSKFVELFGYTEHEMKKAEDWFQLAYPDKKLREKVRHVWRKEMEQARKRGQEISPLEFPVTCKDGSVKYIEFRMKSSGKLNFIVFIDITERKGMMTENKLTESEQQYRTLADYGQALIWTSGLDKKCDYFNKPWLEFTGRTLQQELGDGWVEGVHPDDLERCIEIYSNAFDRREHFSMDYRLRHNSGEYRWIQDDGTPRYDSQGRFIGYIGHCLDIDDRKRAEKELKKRELILSKILDVLPVGLWFADQNGKLLRGNPAGIKIWGAEPKVSVAEYDVFKARRLPSREEVAAEDWALVHTIREGVTIKDELLEIEAFDGVTRIIRNYTAPVYDDEEKLLGAIIVNNDVTRQYQSEEALKESEEKFRKLAESVGAILWEYDIPTDCWTYVAPQAESILGYKPDEWKDLQFWADKIHPNDKHWATEYCAQCTKRGEDHVFEYRFIKKGGEVVWLRDNVKVEVENGKPVKLRGFMADITEYKDAEEKIQILLREKELLLKETHHRIKNNMGTVKSLLNLQAHSTDHPDSRKILKDAASRVQSMMVLYEKLYHSETYAELNVRDFLPSLIHDIVALFQGEKPVRTDLHIDKIVMDSRTLSTLGIILNECITNSMKYAFDAVKDPRITLRVNKDKDKIVVTYSDNGPGCMNNKLPDMRQNFGFHLIDMLVQQLNGTLRIDSTHGMKIVLEF